MNSDVSIPNSPPLIKGPIGNRDRNLANIESRQLFFLFFVWARAEPSVCLGLALRRPSAVFPARRGRCARSFRKPRIHAGLAGIGRIFRRLLLCACSSRPPFAGRTLSCFAENVNRTLGDLSGIPFKDGPLLRNPILYIKSYHQDLELRFLFPICTGSQRGVWIE